MSTEVAISHASALELASQDFMPVFDLARAIERRNLLIKFTQSLMTKDVDFGSPGGIEGKPSLLKAGAEKLVTFFGLTPEFITTEEVEDWTGEKHKGEAFFYYRYKCRLTRNGRAVGEGEGSCNTWESKYRYRWVREDFAKNNGYPLEMLVKRGGRISEFDFAVEKAETGGKYGKPAAYWQTFKDAIADGSARQIEKPMGKERKLSKAWEIDAVEFRVPNPDVADQVNTCQKMAQKRALVAAVLIAVNASEFFTQDIEDMDVIDIPGSSVASRHEQQVDPKHQGEANTEAVLDHKTILAKLKTARIEQRAAFNAAAAELNIKSFADLSSLAQAKEFLGAIDRALVAEAEPEFAEVA
jgi:hypothetical protein